VVCKFASQTGKTEVILNFVGFIIDCDPGPVLAMQPNVSPMGEAFSKDRIAPMLRDSPTLAEKIGQGKSRNSASTITHKTFPNGHLTIVGANSAAGLASRPIKYLVADEIDRHEPTKEGDSLTLARKRLQTFRVRRSAKELLVSSPTYADLGISVEYAKCTQQHEWHLTCQHCGEHQFPKLAHFQWDQDKPHTVRYACEHCGAEHPLQDADKVKASGRWVCVKDEGPESVGFHMNQWASPFARWDDTVAEWLAAGADPLQKQAVMNTAFAEPWEGEGDRVDAHVLEQRAEFYAAEVPAGVQVITLGVDLQIDRMELEVVGWGEGETSWNLDYQVLPGEPTSEDVWKDLLEIYRRKWTHESGAIMQASAMCIDSGNWSKHVYTFVKNQKDRRIIPIKGASPFGADVLSGGRKDRRLRAIKRLRDGRPPEVLGVSQIKLIIARRLVAVKDKPGYCHFPKTRDREYFDQLTGERLVSDKKRGKRAQMVWHRVHPHVEALDCRVYAYAALLLIDGDVRQVAKPKAQQPQKTTTRIGMQSRGLIR
jgi:phage terminase large subunit GpA-like protein